MAAGGQRCGSNLNILLAPSNIPRGYRGFELNSFGPLEKDWQIIIIETNGCPLRTRNSIKHISLDLREHKISLSRSAIYCVEQSHCRSGTQVERFGRRWRCSEPPTTVAEAPALLHQKTNNAIKHRMSSSSRPAEHTKKQHGTLPALSETTITVAFVCPNLYYSLTASISICGTLIPDPCASMDPAQ